MRASLFRRHFVLSLLVVVAGGLGAALTFGTVGAHAARRHRGAASDDASVALDPSSVSAPRDQEACFAPDEPCDLKLLKFVASAQRSVDIAIYDINLDELVHQLLVQNRKIKVRVVVDRKQAKGEHSLVALLMRAGVRIRYGRQRGIMHNKFTLVDGKMLELGSFNYTHHAARANQENQLYLATPAVVSRYQARFDQIWAQATEH